MHFWCAKGKPAALLFDLNQGFWACTFNGKRKPIAGYFLTKIKHFWKLPFSLKKPIALPLSQTQGFLDMIILDKKGKPMA